MQDLVTDSRSAVNISRNQFPVRQVSYHPSNNINQLCYDDWTNLSRLLSSWYLMVILVNLTFHLFVKGAVFITVVETREILLKAESHTRWSKIRALYLKRNVLFHTGHLGFDDISGAILLVKIWPV